MGQMPIFSYCLKERNKEENLTVTKATDFFFSQGKSNISLIDRPVLKTKKNSSPLNLTVRDGDSYIVQEGFGIIYFSNKSLFKGLFHEGVPNGWGIYINPSNGVFKGKYEKDKPNGYGIYEHISESTYEGNWINEKQEGIGIEKWIDGAIYKGEFSFGQKSGIGTYIFPNNNMYIGEWSHNFMNGWGIYTYGKNSIYIGEWKNGLRDGYGEIYEPENNYFFGFFKNNVKNGFFMFYNIKNGKIIVGYNNNGKIDEIVKYFKKDKEGKLIIIKNGKRIMEIEDEVNIIKYFNDKNNLKTDNFNKYFIIKRKELENLLINKCIDINITDIYEQFRYIKNNIIDEK